MSAVRAECGDKAVRWIPAPHLHLTLKFLGDVEEAQVAAIRAALRDALLNINGFPVAARGLGVFPDTRRPRVLWVGLSAPELGLVARRVNQAVEPFGVEQATARFRPHATIARWRRPEPRAGHLRDGLARWRDHRFGEFRIDEVTLFQSTLRPGGAVYSALDVFPLAAAGSHPAGMERRETDASNKH